MYRWYIYVYGICMCVRVWNLDEYINNSCMNIHAQNCIWGFRMDG